MTHTGTSDSWKYSTGPLQCIGSRVVNNEDTQKVKTNGKIITFLIQAEPAKHIQGAPRVLPSQIEGSVAIELINYANWFNNETLYEYTLVENFDVTTSCMTEDKKLPTRIIPIGSVEFVLNYLKQMGIQSVTPLNIPPVLWRYVSRDIKISNPDIIANDGKWFVKSLHKIKSQYNDMYDGDRDSKSVINQTVDVFGDEDVFMTRWIDDVISEWRVFVYDKEIIGIRNYAGDEWTLPDKAYISKIVQEYDKRSYALDVMVNKEFSHYTTHGYSYYVTITDTVELHDFFACGLYGMSDPKLLPMWITAIQDILKKEGEN
jgi:hypothetical protein